ncbi:MAG: hypothetical protein QNJ34_16780 [Xenococcaceae cyanobacterium MO_188.B29]|nr:hypothetical protein [Xenococcaceae cyanobacterium MO_188.B29]
MKLKIKTLGTTLVLASLLGACSSVNSSTPSMEEPSVNSGIELESPEGIESVDEVPTDNIEMENSELETSEETMTGLESVESETPELETSEDPTLETESAEMENSELEAVELDTPEIESSEAPVEPQGSEIVLPVDDDLQTPTESEAAENSTLESAQ